MIDPERRDLIQELTECIGVPALLRLLERFGGLEIKVPARFDSFCPMARCLGEPDYRCLWGTYRGERLSLPLLSRRRLADIRREIVERKAAGETAASLALEYGKTERGIRWIVAREREREREGDERQEGFEFG